MVDITDSAKDVLEKVLQENPGKVLRVVVQGFG